MFGVETMIVQYGSRVGFNLAPLKASEYAKSFMIGVGSMMWYYVSYRVWKKCGKNKVSEERVDNDDNYNKQ